MLRKAVVPLLAALVMLVVGVPAAGAADVTTTLDFDKLAPETFVTGQYPGLTFERYIEAGFTFGNPPGNGTFHYDCIPGPRVFATSPTHSGGQAADLGCDDDMNGEDGAFAALSTLADKVSVYVGSTDAAGQEFTLYAWNVSRELVAHKTITTGATGIGNQMEVSTAGFEIAYLAIEGPPYPPKINAKPGPPGVFAPFISTPEIHAIDDLAFVTPEAPVPDLSVVFNPTSTPLNVAEGQSVKVPVSIARLNGSHGNVTLSVSGLPAGVTATVAPSTLKGTETSATIELTATASAALGATTATITATPGEPSAGVAPRSIAATAQVLQAFEVSVPQSPTNVAPCTEYTFPVTVESPALLTGSVALAATPVAGAPAGTQVSISPTEVSAFNGHATLVVTGSPALANHEGFAVEVTGTLAGSPSSTSFAHLVGFPGRIATTASGYGTPSFAALPALASNGAFGSSFSLGGEGFCPGDQVQFGNHLARTPGTASGDGRTLTGTVPELASSGPIDVLTPHGETLRSSSPVHVSDYRDTYGFDAKNQGVGSGPGYPKLNDEMVRSTFPGANLELPWGPGLTPEAIIMEDVVNQSLKAGFCFGFSLADLLFLDGREKVANLPNSGPSIFQLTGETEPSVPLGEMLAEDFSVQFSDQVIGQVTGQIFENWIAPGGSAPQVSEVKEQLAKHEPPIIGMVPGLKGGHAVVAYATESLPEGRTAIDVYNSNVPYRPAEEEPNESSDNAELHFARDRTLSQIIVQGDPSGHWEFAQMGWTGDSSNLLVFPQSKLPVLDGKFPSTPNLFTIAGVDIAMAGTGDQIAGGADVSGNTSWNAATASFRPKSGRPDLAAWDPLVGANGPPRFIAGTSPGATVDVARHGAGDVELLGQGLGAQLQTGARTGTDHVAWNPKAGSLTLHNAAASPITATVIQAPGASAAGAAARSAAVAHDERLAQVSDTGSRGGSEAWRMSGGSLTLSHTGAPTTAHITLQAIGAGQSPYAVALPAIALASGAKVSVTPSSWSSLPSTAIRVSVRRHGRTSVRTVHGRTLGAVLARVTRATLRRARTGAVLALAVKVGHVPAGATVTLVAGVKGPRSAHVHPLVLHGADTRPGTHTLSFALGRLPRGRYRITAVVGSTAAGGSALRAARPARFGAAAKLR